MYMQALCTLNNSSTNFLRNLNWIWKFKQITSDLLRLWMMNILVNLSLLFCVNAKLASNRRRSHDRHNVTALLSRYEVCPFKEAYSYEVFWTSIINILCFNMLIANDIASSSKIGSLVWHEMFSKQSRLSDNPHYNNNKYQWYMTCTGVLYVV